MCPYWTQHASDAVPNPVSEHDLISGLHSVFAEWSNVPSQGLAPRGAVRTATDRQPTRVPTASSMWAHGTDCVGTPGARTSRLHRPTRTTGEEDGGRTWVLRTTSVTAYRETPMHDALSFARRISAHALLP